MHRLWLCVPMIALLLAGCGRLEVSEAEQLALSGEMLLRHLGWTEAAELINQGIEKAITDRVVTYDFARMMENATEVGCSDFAKAVVERM